MCNHKNPDHFSENDLVSDFDIQDENTLTSTKELNSNFLSLDDNIDCPCPICDAEKQWASEQIDKWISKFA